ncbi:MAG TPA: hydroxysqualene dehydroxylase HpnE [Candidatus Acidoferrales bacterium]|nr:hydroxysqualene dehydroxylase HpnE [Candidatus Acidoferrales bacterium]
MPFETVNVIGGGLAGLSAALALAESGIRVRLFEKRPYFGGRATSYALPDGSHIDNCQHVTLGCCTNLADFYRRVRAESKIRHYDRLFFADRAGRVSSIYSSFLPPPFHMTFSFLRFRALAYRDKQAIARGLLLIARSCGRPADAGGATMLDWLRRNGQTEEAITRFWRVVLVSALDEELDRTDARYGIDVFWKAFLASRRGYILGIPSVPLGDLYAGCRIAIEREGGEVRSRAAVRGIRVADGRFHSLQLDDGAEVRADACICAVPHDSFLGLLPPEILQRDASLANINRLRTSPITGVHLWFDRTVLDKPFLTLLDHTVQWIFNKSLLYAPTGAPENSAGQYLQLVISASYDLIPRSRQEIIDLCIKELHEVLPPAREAKLQKATVVKEVNATFSPEPGSDAFRPPQQTAIPGLFLAGDWTRTGWPATMEGAVRSGYLAAEALLNFAGAPRKFLVPDLPVEGFCRRWARQLA